MLTMTDAASKKLAEIIAEQGEPVYGLRVSAQQGGCSCHKFGLSLAEAAAPGDWVGVFGSVKVLVDSESAPEVTGANIDWVETLQGSGFTIASPTPATGRGCGCGHGHGHTHGDAEHAGSETRDAQGRESGGRA